MMSDEQPAESDAPGDKKAAVQGSIKKLQKKVVPGIKYTLIIDAAINFVMLVIGCINVHKCPVNSNIPLFLIATGALGLLSKFVRFIKDRLSLQVRLKYLETALYGTQTIFFCLGTYWVFKEFQPSYSPTSGYKYCNKTAYIAAFTYVAFFFAVLIAMICGFCCLICYACYLAKTSLTEDSEAPAEHHKELVPKSTVTDNPRAEVFKEPTSVSAEAT